MQAHMSRLLQEKPDIEKYTFLNETNYKASIPRLNQSANFESSIALQLQFQLLVRCVEKAKIQHCASLKKVQANLRGKLTGE